MGNSRYVRLGRVSGGNTLSIKNVNSSKNSKIKIPGCIHISISAGRGVTNDVVHNVHHRAVPSIHWSSFCRYSPYAHSAQHDGVTND